MVSGRRLHIWIIASTLCMLLLTLPGCSTQDTNSQYADNPIAQRETLSQVSTMEALMEGLYDGVITYGELERYGDFGIGTFDNLDGEMIGFDGIFYQVRTDGVAYEVSDNMTAPFADVTFFDADLRQDLPEHIDYEQLKEYIDSILPTVNIFYAIKVEGTFSYLKTRSVPAQEKPYPPLNEVIQQQTTFIFNDIEGTMVGFRCPEFVTDINVPGYHLHFLNGNRDAGGHVLEFVIEDAVVSVDYTSDFYMILPTEGSGFYEADFTQN
jgi:acetolactate decarboxylase